MGAQEKLARVLSAEPLPLIPDSSVSPALQKYFHDLDNYLRRLRTKLTQAVADQSNYVHDVVSITGTGEYPLVNHQRRLEDWRNLFIIQSVGFEDPGNPKLFTQNSIFSFTPDDTNIPANPGYTDIHGYGNTVVCWTRIKKSSGKHVLACTIYGGSAMLFFVGTFFGSGPLRSLE